MAQGQEFDRDAFAVQILSELASGKEYEGNQIGPEHTLDQIEVIADLIEKGHVAGYVLPGQNGRPVNIGGPRITAFGRDYLKALAAENNAKKPTAILKAQAKKAVGPVFKWIAGIGAFLLGAWLLKRFGLK